MMIILEFFFPKSKDAFILDEYKDILTQDDDWYFIKFRYSETSNIIEELMKSIEDNKVEVFLSMKDNNIGSWILDLMSLLVDNKIYLIHRYTKIDVISNVKSYEYDFTDKRQRRKAKLKQIESNIDLNPEHLWNNSWYEKFPMCNSTGKKVGYSQSRFSINYI